MLIYNSSDYTDDFTHTEGVILWRDLPHRAVPRHRKAGKWWRLHRSAGLVAYGRAGESGVTVRWHGSGLIHL